MRRLGRVALAVVVLMTGAAQAEDTTASKDFTFKRVKVGEARSTGKRVMVQIDPAEQARILAINPAVPVLPKIKHDDGDAAATAAVADAIAEATGAKRKTPGAAYEWYWDLLSPEIAESRAGRMETAVAALRNGPGGATVKAPRLSTLQAIADTHGTDILKATIGTKVSPALVLAVIGIESAGRTAAVSSAGATGLMQLMPATAERFGVTDRTNPTQSIEGGVAYLDWLLNHFGRDPVLALAGYNAGEGAVKTHGGVPPYAETRDYVPKVIAAWSVAKGLCLTPPELVSDGCVFRRGVQTAARITE